MIARAVYDPNNIHGTRPWKDLTSSIGDSGTHRKEGVSSEKEISYCWEGLMSPFVFGRLSTFPTKFEKKKIKLVAFLQTELDDPKVDDPYV